MQVDGWKPTRIGDFAREVSERSRGGEEVLSCTKHEGFVPSLEYFGKQVFSKETDAYKLVKRGQYAYATIHLDEGSIDCLEIRDRGIISPMYTVFDVDPERVDRKFLLELLRTPWMLNRYAGIGQGSINRRKSISFDTLALETVPLPPLPEQKKIAAILSSVDEATQATRAVIEQTRRMKEGLLQDLLTRGIGHTRFQQTEIGEIPEGWELRRLGEISYGGIRNGIFKKREEFGGGIPLINVLDCFTGPPVELSRLERVRADADEVRRFGAQDGDLLFIRSSLNVDGIGHSAVVLGVTEPTVFECHIMRVRPTGGVEPRFLYHYTKSRSFRRRIMANAQTTTMTTLPQDGLGLLEVPIPPQAEQRQIADTLDSLNRQVEKHSASISAFESVKKGLLQDLLTGKVRVSM